MEQNWERQKKQKNKINKYKQYSSEIFQTLLAVYHSRKVAGKSQKQLFRGVL